MYPERGEITRNFVAASLITSKRVPPTTSYAVRARSCHMRLSQCRQTLDSGLGDLLELHREVHLADAGFKSLSVEPITNAVEVCPRLVPVARSTLLDGRGLRGRACPANASPQAIQRASPQGPEFTSARNAMLLLSRGRGNLEGESQEELAVCLCQRK